MPWTFLGIVIVATTMLLGIMAVDPTDLLGGGGAGSLIGMAHLDSGSAGADAARLPLLHHDCEYFVSLSVAGYLSWFLVGDFCPL